MILDRTIAPRFNKIEHITFPKVRQVKLDNGMVAYVLNGGSQDVIKLDLMVQAGSVFAKNKLTAPITGLMLNEGSINHSSHQIAEVFDFYGAYFQPMVEKDRAFVGLISLNKHFKETLPLFSEIVFNSVFPASEFENLLERRRQKFLIDQQKTSFVAREMFNEQIFGANHPYGYVTKEDHYKSLTQNEVFSFYKSCYTPANVSVLLSGKVTDNSIALINKHLGQLQATQITNIPNVKPEPNYSGTPFISEKNNAVQSSVRMGTLAINKTHADYIGLKILITILGGYFGSRLMKNIREEKGYTYGIHAMLVSLQNTGYVGIAADVKSEHTKEAIEEIKKEIEKLRTTYILNDELSLVQNYMMGEMLHMFDGPFATSDSFKAVLEYNMDFEYYERMKNTILSITPQQLLDIAKKYLDIHKMIVTVAGRYE